MVQNPKCTLSSISFDSLLLPHSIVSYLTIPLCLSLSFFSSHLFPSIPFPSPTYSIPHIKPPPFSLNHFLAFISLYHVSFHLSHLLPSILIHFLASLFPVPNLSTQIPSFDAFLLSSFPSLFLSLPTLYFFSFPYIFHPFP